jgi:type III secretion protein N (ATPase)
MDGVCIMGPLWEGKEIWTQVIRFEQQAAILMPLNEPMQIPSATELLPTGDVHKVGIGDDLLGRVVDSLARVIVESVE